MNTELDMDMPRVEELTSDVAQNIAGNKYLSFVVAAKSYGVDISRITEIIEYFSVTAVPMTPPYVRGVINLRGRVVPVIDLASRMGKLRSEVGKRSCIVIVEVAAAGEAVEVGFMVDGVTEVISLNENMIEQTPSFGLNMRPDFVSGVGKIDKGLVILLDIDQVLSINELADACEQYSESAPIERQKMVSAS